MAPPLALAPGRTALFLDFDGTLVEIAARPDEVVVPPALPPLLLRLAGRLGGALAIVSGRTLAELDAFLPVALPKAAEHGATLRRGAGAAEERPALPALPAAWRDRAAALAAATPGLLLEDKAHGFALHYRQAPDAAGATRALLDELLAEDPAFVLLPARMAWEVKPAAVSKGSAVRAFLSASPFAGRVPVFIGDDVTDQDGMAAAEAAGGEGLMLQDAFGTPAALHAWLERLAEAPA